MIVKPIHINDIVTECDFREFNKIFVIGNGGSHANAVHFASDLREIGMNADALDNPSNMTAIGNDFGYDQVFKKQLETKYINEYSLLIAISGSGNSKNILEAVNYAKSCNTPVYAITMANQGKLRSIGDYCYLVKTSSMEDFETTTLGIIHAIKRYYKKWTKNFLKN